MRFSIGSGRWWLASAIIVGLGCGNAGVVGDVGITCGPGTRLEGRRCVPAEGPTGPQVQDLRVPVLFWDAAEGDRLEVNHRLPIAMDIAAVPQPGLTEAQLDETVPVNVQVFLVRAGSGPVADRRCAVGGDTLLVSRGGDPEHFDASLTIPRGCLVNDAPTEFELMVELSEDLGNGAVSGLSRTLHFTTQSVMDAARAESFCRLDEGDERCDLSFQVEPPEGNENFTHTVRPQSNVGVLWTPASTGGLPATNDQLPPNLSLEVVTRGYGNDPGSDEDDELPGPLHLSVQIAPAAGANARLWAPVHVSMRELPSEVEPPQEARSWQGNAEDRSYAHLYLPPELQTRMTTGDWAGNDVYLVRVCERADGWQEDEEPTDVDPRWQADSEGDEDSSCRVHRVRFTRPLAASTTRSRSWGWQRQWEKGGDHLGGSAGIGTNTNFSVLFSSAAGWVRSSLSFFGHTFTPFGIEAAASGNLRSPASSQMNLRFVALGQTLRDVSRSLSGERRIRAEADLGSVMRELCRRKGFSVGPVPVEVEGCIRGEMGLTGYVELRGGTTDFPAEFGSGTGWVAAEAGIVPSARLGITARGGVGGGGVSAGVEVDLNILETSLPLTAIANGAISAPPGVNPPSVGALDCPAWVRSNPSVPQGVTLNPNDCFGGFTITRVLYQQYFNTALGSYQQAISQYEQMARPRLSGRVSLDLTLEFLSGRFGLYARLGILRVGFTIASWGGIGGLGGGRSRVNVFNFGTGVIDL